MLEKVKKRRVTRNEDSEHGPVEEEGGTRREEPEGK
jgi:hypothetical protein